MPTQGHCGNQLIDALPVRQRDSLLARAESIDLELKKILYRADEPIRTVYFPTGTVLSVVAHLRDGTAIEIKTLGREGTNASPIFLGMDARSGAECICQVAGTALAIRSDDFRREVEGSPALRDLMNRYVAALLVYVGQGVACSRLHSSTQRCARWLLMTADRVGRDEFHLTHEFLGFMIGSRRATVTQALAKLSQANLVRSHRGDIQIIDRNGLHRLACECYDVILKAMTEVTHAPGR